MSAPAIRRAARALSECCLPGVTTGGISICLVSARRMAQINEQFLGHSGPTDVITFDYGTERDRSPNSRLIQGNKQSAATSSSNKGIEAEILICPEVASSQSRSFGVGWRHEVLRYLAHGFLHLAGHDDLDPARRKVMKRAENGLVHQMAAKLGGPWTAEAPIPVIGVPNRGRNAASKRAALHRS